MCSLANVEFLRACDSERPITIASNAENCAEQIRSEFVTIEIVVRENYMDVI